MSRPVEYERPPKPARKPKAHAEGDPVRIKLVRSSGSIGGPSPVADAVIPWTKEAPFVVVFEGHVFRRWGALGGYELRDDDVYLLCTHAEATREE